MKNTVKRSRHDINHVKVSGQINKIWSNNEDVYVGLDLGDKSQATLMLKSGEVNGEMVTLMQGDEILVHGFVKDAPYFESLQKFLERSKSNIPNVPDVEIKRAMTVIVPESLESDPEEKTNIVRLEGTIVRSWRYDKDLFARIAIFDIRAQEQQTNAYYVTLKYTKNTVSNRKVTLDDLKEGSRIKVSGRILESRYQENLNKFLGRTDVDLNMLKVEKATAERTWANYLQTVVEVGQMIQFSKKTKK
ncbi:MAG: hypothetical protein JEZ06_08910 [Anaerolineaceae bacterium]|nr:hypothetical protein [Anaerolineaceae bacterium]